MRCCSYWATSRDGCTEPGFLGHTPDPVLNFLPKVQPPHILTASCHRARHTYHNLLADVVVQCSLQSHLIIKREATMKTATPVPPVQVVAGYVPGVLGRCLDMHLRYYSKSNGFGKTFELDLAANLEHFLRRLDHPDNEAFVALSGDAIIGTIFVDGSQRMEDGQKFAKIRAFIVEEAFHGKGIGKMLMNNAMSFVDDQGFVEARLWSFKGLDAARTLYERAGFVVEEENLGKRWGEEVVEQLYVRKIIRGESRVDASLLT